jgi:asparagine synthase (glutamine-hydrolysing)
MSWTIHAEWARVAQTGQLQLAHAVRWGPLAVVAEARIDNCDELRAALRVAPDTSVQELILRAYDAWGGDFADRLSGDFAIVLWDGRERQLVAARDPFGIKPLFYRADEQQIFFSDAIASLLRTLNGRAILDDQRVLEYLLTKYKSIDATFFRDIREVPAGHVLVAKPSGVHRRRYWKPPEAPPVAPEGNSEEYFEEFGRLFAQAVRRRLRSDGAVVIQVSGGLDSSAIASAADVLCRAGDLPTPSVIGAAAVYPGLTCDESVFIDAVARAISFPIDRWDGTKVDDTDFVDPRAEEPGTRAIFTGGSVGDIGIAKKYGATVIMSGVGGDELGMIEGLFQDLVANGHWSRAMADLLFFPGATMESRIRRIKTVLKQSLPEAFIGDILKARLKVPLWLAPDLRVRARDILSEDRLEPGPLGRVQRHAWRRLTSAQTLRTVSMSVAHARPLGIEHRFPFLDRELVRFALSIPTRCWPGTRANQRLQRIALVDLYPPEIRGRFGKAEFTSALISRIRRSRGHIQALLDSGEWASSRYVDPDLGRQFCRDVTALGASRLLSWRQVWSIVMFEPWLRRNMGYSSSQTIKELRT